jgi:hypothetical protein
VLLGLAGLARSLEEDRVLASRGPEGKLVKGEDLATSLEDSGTGTLGDAKGADRELGDSEESDVIRHSADAHCDLAAI